MAGSSRWGNPAKLEVIDGYGTVFKGSQKAPDRIFVILFNEVVPQVRGIETRFEKWQQHYEITYKVRFYLGFYKCVISEYEEEIKLNSRLKIRQH